MIKSGKRYKFRNTYTGDEITGVVTRKLRIGLTINNESTGKEEMLTIIGNPGWEMIEELPIED